MITKNVPWRRTVRPAAEVTLGYLNDETSELVFQIISHQHEKLPRYLTGPKPNFAPIEGGEQIPIAGNGWVGLGAHLLGNLRAHKFCFAFVRSGIYPGTTSSIIEVAIRRTGHGCTCSTDLTRFSENFSHLSHFSGDAVIYRNPLPDGTRSLLVTLNDAVYLRARQVIKVSAGKLILRGQL